MLPYHNGCESAVATACLERCHSSPSRSSAATMVQGSVGWFLENTKKVALLPINENKSSLPNPKTTNIGTAPRELKSPPPPHGLLIHTHLKGSCRRAHWVSRISLVKEVEQRTAFLASPLFALSAASGSPSRSDLLHNAEGRDYFRV